MKTLTSLFFFWFIAAPVACAGSTPRVMPPESHQDRSVGEPEGQDPLGTPGGRNTLDNATSGTATRGLAGAPDGNGGTGPARREGGGSDGTSVGGTSP